MSPAREKAYILARVRAVGRSEAAADHAREAAVPDHPAAGREARAAETAPDLPERAEAEWAEAAAREGAEEVRWALSSFWLF